MTEMVILVDEQDEQIGLAEKMQAHEQGLLHRAFSVFVLRPNNDSWEVLLQQRQKDKYHCPNLWANTCCSHPRDKESIMHAAERRLYEEMGMQLPLKILSPFIYRSEFSNGLIEYEYDHVVVGIYNDESINFNNDEVQAYAWQNLDELFVNIEENPELYVPWLLPALQVLQLHLKELNA